MKKPLKRLLATLALATAGVTGLTATDTVATPHAHTALGAADTTDDSGWGSEPTDSGTSAPSTDTTNGDSGWG